MSHLTKISGFDAVPHKVLLKIMNFLPPSELEEKITVCNVFGKIINEHVGIPVSIGMGDNLDEVEHSSITKLSSVGVSGCSVNNLINSPLPSEAVFKYPHVLKILHVTGYISEKNFLRLISSASNLEKLRIDLSSFFYIEFQDLPLPDILPKLTSIKILSELPDGGVANLQWFTSIHSLIGMLQKIFSQLVEFWIRIPSLILLTPILKTKFTRALFQFITKNNTALKRVVVQYEGRVAITENEGFPIENMPREDNDTIDFYAPNECHIDILQAFSLSLDAEEDEDDDDDPMLPDLTMSKNLSKQWLPFLCSQTKLENFELSGSIFFPLLPNIVQNNEAQLRIFCWKLPFKESNGRSNTIDCKIFEKCHRLETIFLGGPSQNENLTLSDEWGRPRLINIGSLPKSIQHICLDNTAVSVAEIAVLGTEFPVIRDVNLDIGHSGGCGISLATLCDLIEKKSMESLYCWKSFNELTIISNNTDTDQRPALAIVKILMMALGVNCVHTSINLKRTRGGEWQNPDRES